MRSRKAESSTCLRSPMLIQRATEVGCFWMARAMSVDRSSKRAAASVANSMRA